MYSLKISIPAKKMQGFSPFREKTPSKEDCLGAYRKMNDSVTYITKKSMNNITAASSV